MDDDFTVEAEGERPLLVAVPKGAGGNRWDSEQASAMATKKALTHRQKRAEQQEIERGRRVQAAESVTSAVDQALESSALDGKSVEELADLIVYRNARIALLGGELFAPTSLKELTETAKAWSVIGKSEADRRRQRLPDEPEATPISDLENELGKLKRKMLTAARARALAVAK